MKTLHYVAAIVQGPSRITPTFCRLRDDPRRFLEGAPMVGRAGSRDAAIQRVREVFATVKPIESRAGGISWRGRDDLTNVQDHEYVAIIVPVLLDGMIFMASTRILPTTNVVDYVLGPEAIPPEQRSAKTVEGVVTGESVEEVRDKAWRNIERAWRCDVEPREAITEIPKSSVEP